MGLLNEQKEMILRKIEELPPELIEEVIDFIEFLQTKRQKGLVSDTTLFLIQQESLKKIWDTEAEDLYEI